MWTWPWSYRPESCGAHIVLLWSTFLLSNFKIHQGMAKLWTRHEKRPHFLPLTSVTFTLVLQTCVLHATHHLRIVNISAESFQNPSRNGKVMAGTKKKTLFFTFDLCVTLTLELQPWVLGATYFSWMSTILPIKSFQNPSRNGSYGRCEKKKTLFFTFDL